MNWPKIKIFGITIINISLRGDVKCALGRTVETGTLEKLTVFLTK